MKSKEELNVLKEEVETLNKKLAELSEEELKQATGGLNVFSDEGTITMYFSSSDNPSEMMTSIKNNIDRQTGCVLHPNVSDTLQNLLNEMSHTGKIYLKINYTKNGEMITDISVNIML